jgi:integrase/recombinase XerD
MAKAARVLQDKNEPGVILDELLLQSWEIAMRAERKSPRTIHIYLTQARAFMAWCASLDSPPRFDRRTVQAFLAAEADRGMSPNKVVARYTGLRQLAV